MVLRGNVYKDFFQLVFFVNKSYRLIDLVKLVVFNKQVEDCVLYLVEFISKSSPIPPKLNIYPVHKVNDSF